MNGRGTVKCHSGSSRRQRLSAECGHDPRQILKVFRPAAAQQRTQQRMLKDLIHKVYDGSAGSLVLHALASQKASPEELAEIRRVLDELGESEK